MTRQTRKSMGLPAALLAAGVALATAWPAATGSLAQEAATADPLKPTLGDLMTLAQLRHFKLWYAQKERNWALANYELGQFQATLARIGRLYPQTGEVAQAAMIRERSQPAVDDLAKAIAERSQARFESGFVRLTEACNQCHKVAGVDFITIQVPTRSPYANQNFAPAR